MTKLNDNKPQQLLQFGATLHGASCFCVVCLRKKTFSMPSDLADLIVKGEVVLFAGAGISTEVPAVLVDSFYDTIEYSVNDKVKDRSFPDLMEDFCKTPQGRVGLLQRLKERFDYVYSHREIYEEATRFHRELATFLPIDTIITTNWDTYFEEECAATPFVDDKDIALWNAAGRKVLKIHGTISNLGSIVATRTDYARCARRLKGNVVGGLLKSLLATRSTVFIGYSLRDDDFLQVYRAVRSLLSDFHRRPYFVAPNIAPEDRQRLVGLGLHLIETDGQFFISELKKYAVENSCFCRDEMYDGVASLLMELSETHDWLHTNLDGSKHPQILFSSWYQDGMMHALERILRLRKTGEQSDLHRLQNVFVSYDRFANRFRKDRNYGDAAYCAGYANGYLFAAQYGDEGRPIKPPLFFYFGYEGRSRKGFKSALRSFPTLHRTAFEFAERLMSRYPKNTDVVLHHSPRLNLGKYM